MTDHDPSPSPARDGQFRNFLQALPIAVYTTDASGLVEFFNPAAEALAGRTPRIGRDRWCVTWRLYHPDGRPMPHEQCPMAVALRENRAIRGVEAIAERPNGSRFPFMPYPTPIRDASGAVSGGINMLVDITERKNEEALRQLLASELDSQVNTVLGLVDTVLSEAQRRASSAEAKRLLYDALRRIAAIGASQRLTHGAEGAGRVASWDLLSAVCMAAQLDVSGRVELSCESTAGDLAAETAMPLMLIAHELVTNATLHGRAGRPKVMVRVGLRREGGGYVLSVEDDGPGFVLSPGHLRSFGLGLVASLMRQLGGTFDIERVPGTRCVVRFPDARTLH